MDATKDKPRRDRSTKPDAVADEIVRAAQGNLVGSFAGRIVLRVADGQGGTANPGPGPDVDELEEALVAFLEAYGFAVTVQITRTDR